MVLTWFFSGYQLHAASSRTCSCITWRIPENHLFQCFLWMSTELYGIQDSLAERYRPTQTTKERTSYFADAFFLCSRSHVERFLTVHLHLPTHLWQNASLFIPWSTSSSCIPTSMQKLSALGRSGVDTALSASSTWQIALLWRQDSSSKIVLGQKSWQTLGFSFNGFHVARSSLYAVAEVWCACSGDMTLGVHLTCSKVTTTPW